MRNVILRLIVVLAFWFSFLDLFVGKVNWRWTLCVAVVFFLLEGLARLALRLYLGPSKRDLRERADHKGNLGL
jgi:hypothetical protein